MTEFEYTCDTCSLKRTMSYLWRVYSLPGDRLLPMDQRHFWCNSCGAISVAECVAEAKPPESILLSDRNVFEDNQEVVLETFLMWKSMRQRPSRCLRCGVENVSVPECDSSDLAHYPCGGEFECLINVESSSPRYIPFPHVYSTEGDLLEAGHYFDSQHGRIARDLPYPLWYSDKASISR